MDNRKIAYLYQYHENIAHQMVGSMRYTTNQMTGKLTIHMKRLHFTKDCVGKCSLLYCKYRYPLGNIYLKAGVGEGKYILHPNQFPQNQELINELEGVLIEFEGQQEKVAGFFEEQISLNKYSEIRSEAFMEASLDERDKIYEEAAEDSLEKTIEEPVEELTEKAQIERKEDEKEEYKQEEFAAESSETDRVYQKLKEQFPNIQPFDEEDHKEYLSITPRELEFFGREQISLMNNSFLLHGYQNFKYLILEKDVENRMYSVGVPGVYYEKEEMMAKLFGFTCFKPANHNHQNSGDFGYYFRRIAGV